MMDKPDLDSIEGLSPAISIQQKTTNKNPRSTVGTITEIYDYMRLLYARVGTPHCTGCNRMISTQSADVICDSVLRNYADKQIMVLAPIIQHKKGTHDKVLDQIKRDGYSRVRVDGDVLNLNSRTKVPTLDKKKWHDIQIVVDRITVATQERSRLFESIETAITASRGDVMVVPVVRSTINTSTKKASSTNIQEEIFSQNNACPHCGLTIGELEPRNFSFNSPFGMCDTCNGLGVILEFDPDLVIPDKSLSILGGAIAPWTGKYSWRKRDMLEEIVEILGFDMMTPIDQLNSKYLDLMMWGGKIKVMNKKNKNDYDIMAVEGIIRDLKHQFNTTKSESLHENLKKFMRDIPCKKCNGQKLKPQSLAVRINNKGIMDVSEMSIRNCYNFFATVTLTDSQRHIARDILKEIQERLEFLMNVGLDYLTLNRRSSTLSGGESQRIRLATQIGSNLTGVLYVLDEPTIGLHQRDNARLIKTLDKLRKLGNTVIIVEHDEEVIRSSDWIIDLGPGAGVHGGDVVFEGTLEDMLGGVKSITGQYLRGEKVISLENTKVRRSLHLLNKISIKGAAANNLKNIDVEIPLGMFVCITGVSGSGKSTLINDILLKSLRGYFSGSNEKPGEYKKIVGINHIDNVIAINQAPIGKTPRSNPATYTKAFDPIRDIFSNTRISNERGYSPGRFSFNVHEGRCFACSGAGVKQIEMQFLSDVYVKCDECKGKRFNSETLAVMYRGKTIADVLDMTVSEALDFFKNIPKVRRKIVSMSDVGLGYIKLGQSSTTLSGGEAQRVKLANELAKVGTGRTLYILDEPTTGLHFADVQKLLDVLNKLVNSGNTVVVIEHNMDVICNSDWIIDLGPEGGDEGGNVVCVGTPRQVADSPGSYTGKYIKDVMARR